MEWQGDYRAACPEKFKFPNGTVLTRTKTIVIRVTLMLLEAAVSDVGALNR